jgi:excisionase family DNA binding protein
VDGLNRNGWIDYAGIRIRVAEAAQYLGLSARTLYNGIAPKSKNPFPVRHKKQGKVVLFEKEDLDKYADNIPYADD